MNNDAVMAGQAVYSKKMLSFYDIFVLGISNHFLWKCPTRKISQLFKSTVSLNHLDVGVGTGYYLKKHLPEGVRRIGLVDLNQNSLDATSYAISQFSPEVYRRNVFEPLNLEAENFDSISINYLLHCLPGSMNEKGVIFKHLNEVLNEGGKVFGSTILGNTEKNYCAKKLMSFYNEKGIFTNESDDLESLERVLNTHFEEVNIEVIGCVALFTGTKK